MGINLGCRDVGVSQHYLYAAQIGAALQQMGGEAVAQHMRREAAENARFFAVSRRAVSRNPGGSGIRRGQSRTGTGWPALQKPRPAVLQIFFDGLQRLPADRNEPLLVSLAGGAEDAELARPGRSCATRHSSETRSPVAKSSSSMARSRRPVGLARSMASTIFSISLRFRNLGIVCHCRGERRCSVGILVDRAFAEEKAVEAAQGGEVPRDGAAAEPGLVEMVEVGAEALTSTGAAARRRMISGTRKTSINQRNTPGRNFPTALFRSGRSSGTPSSGNCGSASDIVPMIQYRRKCLKHSC